MDDITRSDSSYEAPTVTVLGSVESLTQIIIEKHGDASDLITECLPAATGSMTINQ